MERNWSTIETVEFAGGELCLDFVNTTGNRETLVPRERLHDLKCWRVFLERGNVFGGKKARLKLSNKDFVEAWLPKIIEFRELLFRLFQSALAGKVPVDVDQDRFRYWIEEVHRSRSHCWSKGKLHFDWSKPNVTDTESALLRIAHSAMELLTGEELKLIRQCGECDWMFLDRSKNKSRQWCRKTCGDRVKSRRYYEKNLKLKRK